MYPYSTSSKFNLLKDYPSHDTSASPGIFYLCIVSVKNILIIQTAFIGDVILALPLAQRLRQAFPNAVIHFLVRKGNEVLVEQRTDIDRVWIWDKKSQKSVNLLRINKALREIDFDLVLNCQRFFSTGFLSAMMKTTERRGFRENPWSFTYTYRIPHIKSDPADASYMHEVQRNLNLLEGICDTKLLKPVIQLHDRHRQKVAHFLSPYVVLAPASVWFTKQWPEDRWCELAAQLPDSILCIIIGAPEDAPLAERILKHTQQGVNLCGELSLMESAALMENALRVISNDSAPLHLASAVNAPVTGIFCSTLPAFGFYPLSDDSRILESPQMLNCRPCGLHGKKSCPEGHFKCGYNIHVQMVIDTIRKDAHRNPQSTTERL
jgi:heptosyltransferase II